MLYKCVTPPLPNESDTVHNYFYPASSDQNSVLEGSPASDHFDTLSPLQERGGRFFMESVSAIQATQSVAWTSVQDRRLAPLTSQHVPISALQQPSAMQVVVTESGRKFPMDRVGAWKWKL